MNTGCGNSKQSENVLSLDIPVKNRTISQNILNTMKVSELSGKAYGAYHPVFDSLNRLSVIEIGMVGADYHDDHTSFRVVVLDIDNDGVYGEKDEMHLAPVGTDSIVTVFSNHFSRGQNPIIIKCRGVNYQLKIKPGSIRQIEINQVTSDVAHFEYLDYLKSSAQAYREISSGDTVSLGKFTDRGKAVFILSTSTTCKGCITGISKIEEILNSNPQLDFISIYQQSDSIYLINEYTEPLKAYSNHYLLQSLKKDFRKDYLIGGYPEGILFDEKGIIIRDRLTPAGLLNRPELIP